MTTFVRPDPLPGMFDDIFWKYVAQEDLRLQRCSQCGQFRYPPGPCCPNCLSPESVWTSLSGNGRVISWNEFQRQYFPTMPPPYVVAAIETDEGPIMIGNIPSPADAMSFGAPVTVYFEHTETVSGKPLTICQWRLQD